MPGTEVEDPALPPGPAAAAAKHLAACEGADEDELVRRRDVEVLPVHLVLRDDEHGWHALGDVVRRRDRPDDLALAVVAPPEAAASPHQPEERLRIVARVEGDEAHPVEHVLDHPVDDGVVHGLVRAMAPPQENVGALEHVSREPVLGVQRVAVRIEATSPSSERRAAATASWIPSG